MPFRKNIISLCVLCSLSSCAAEAVAQPKCETAAIAKLPEATRALKNWEAAEKILVSADAGGDVLQAYCDAAKYLVEKKSLNWSDVDKKSGKVISTYLDAYKLTDPETESLRALLLAEFGASGLAKPEVKTKGLIDFVYVRSVDKIRVREEEFDPWPQMLVPAGDATIAGFKQGAEVCSGSVVVSPVTKAKFEC